MIINVNNNSLVPGKPIKPSKNKYVSARTIATKIARNNKHLEFDIYDIVEWCAEAERNIGEYASFVEHKDIPLHIDNLRALAPCGIYRVLFVKSNGNNFYNYNFDGTFFNFRIGIQQRITIDYIGIPLDEEDGFPLILDTHEEACYWYCLSRLYLEDFLTGKMDKQRYDFIDLKYVTYKDRAKTSMKHMSRDEVDEINMIIHNWIPSVRMPKNI